MLLFIYTNYRSCEMFWRFIWILKFEISTKNICLLHYFILQKCESHWGHTASVVLHVMTGNIPFLKAFRNAGALPFAVWKCPRRHRPWPDRYGPHDGIPWHVDDLLFGILASAIGTCPNLLFFTMSERKKQSWGWCIYNILHMWVWYFAFISRSVCVYLYIHISW